MRSQILRETRRRGAAPRPPASDEKEKGGTLATPKSNNYRKKSEVPLAGSGGGVVGSFSFTPTPRRCIFKDALVLALVSVWIKPLTWNLPPSARFFSPRHTSRARCSIFIRKHDEAILVGAIFISLLRDFRIMSDQQAGKLH